MSCQTFTIRITSCFSQTLWWCTTHWHLFVPRLAQRQNVSWPELQSNMNTMIEHRGQTCTSVCTNKQLLTKNVKLHFMMRPARDAISTQKDPLDHVIWYCTGVPERDALSNGNATDRDRWEASVQRAIRSRAGA
jgi:hypothetical protein